MKTGSKQRRRSCARVTSWAPDGVAIASPTATGSLAGRRILLFAVRYFGYEQEIIAELKRRGAEVDFLPDRPFDTPVMAALSRYARRAILPAAYSFYRARLRELGEKPYTDVLVINGQTMPKRLLAELRAELPRARFTFYIWDSMRNKPGAAGILPFFDDCISFDPDAARTYGMRLRPLFFIPGFDESPDDSAKEWDVSFIGTMHSDRYRILSSIDRELGRDLQRYWYMYLKAPWVLSAQKLINPAFRGARPNEFHYAPLAGSTVKEVFKGSRSIIDIEHPHQTGLTMRTFEALGAGKKLVTTNAGVRDTDFYDPANIHVVDRSNPVVSNEFIRSPYRPIDPGVRARYSLAGWVDEVMRVEK